MGVLMKGEPIIGQQAIVSFDGKKRLGVVTNYARERSHLLWIEVDVDIARPRLDPRNVELIDPRKT